MTYYQCEVHTSTRLSSVGRAYDCKRKQKLYGRWFDSGSRDRRHLLFSNEE